MEEWSPPSNSNAKRYGTYSLDPVLDYFLNERMEWPVGVPPMTVTWDAVAGRIKDWVQSYELVEWLKEMDHRSRMKAWQELKERGARPEKKGVWTSPYLASTSRDGDGTGRQF